ncbi:unnamed protein product [Prunus armeniaca]|nr:unnamed protein product [Prunus armeniaca]CAB4286231.1 unnamed protein product [Prunus armeniaca]CAB4293921.1 unnamed protein product [Prunus armeniaca]CAB4316595.1 unnamed protein product [Prunus armeniaca]
MDVENGANEVENLEYVPLLSVPSLRPDSRTEAIPEEEFPVSVLFKVVSYSRSLAFRLQYRSSGCRSK